ncbi:MAG: type II toxin-antitoxin system RatA family toxin [Gammaproteobacteria bacterium]|nr:type II toxin-antitoxin system RatA family toxin [Gammaproteobacteria bacterium]
MTAIRRSALVPYSAHEMFALVADIPSYPRFLPWCGGARIVSANEDEMIAAIDIAYSGVHKTFTTRNLLQRDKMMELRLMEGPFSRLQGFWRFDALDERACRISLDLEFEVASRLVGVVLTPVFSGIANRLVDSFHRRAVQLYGKRP